MVVVVVVAVVVKMTMMMMMMVMMMMMMMMMMMVTQVLLVLKPLAGCHRSKCWCLLLLVCANTSTTCYQSHKCQSRSQIRSQNQSLY